MVVSLGRRLVFLLLFALFFLPASSGAEPSDRETLLTSRESLPTLENEQTENSDPLDALLNNLTAEAQAQFEDSKKLVEQLAASQTAASELSILSKQLEGQLLCLESTLDKEREAAAKKIYNEQVERMKAESRAKMWKTGIVVTGSIAFMEFLYIVAKSFF